MDAKPCVFCVNKTEICIHGVLRVHASFYNYEIMKICIAECILMLFLCICCQWIGILHFYTLRNEILGFKTLISGLSIKAVVRMQLLTLYFVHRWQRG